MGSVMRYFANVRRPVGAGAVGFVSLGFASLGFASLGMVAALAQAQPQPGEVPYLNYAPASPSTDPARLTPPAPRLEQRPSSVPAAKSTPASKDPGAPDALKHPAHAP